MVKKSILESFGRWQIRIDYLVLPISETSNRHNMKKIISTVVLNFDYYNLA